MGAIQNVITYIYSLVMVYAIFEAMANNKIKKAWIIHFLGDVAFVIAICYVYTKGLLHERLFYEYMFAICFTATLLMAIKKYKKSTNKHDHDANRFLLYTMIVLFCIGNPIVITPIVVIASYVVMIKRANPTMYIPYLDVYLPKLFENEYLKDKRAQEDKDL